MHGRIKAALVGILPFAMAVGTMAAGPFGQKATPSPQIIDTDTRIDINNVDMYVTNGGSLGFDLEGSNYGYFFPKGTDKSAIFAAGMWVGARVAGDDAPRVTVAEYSQEFAAGPVINGVPANEADASYRVYKVTRGDTEAQDYLEWPSGDGAPLNTDGTPAILGDQTLWAVYNDLVVAKHNNDAGNSAPLGLEVQQSVFAFDRVPPLGNMIFVKWIFINKGTNTLNDTYVSVWSDPDLGGAADDLVGCDTTLSLGYCYNADNDDEIYGTAVPAVGFDFFQGPIVPSPGDTAHVSGRAVPGYRNLPMTSFNKYINGTDPGSPVNSYNYMQGFDPDGNDITDPITGRVTKFFVAGDPVTNSGWLDDNPADRRLMLSSGPFTMAPGDTQEVVAGIIIAQGSDRLSSISLLKQYDEQAQAVFDLNFVLPSPPPRPTVYARAYDREVDLIWGTEADGDVQISKELGEEYHFQGFNVYQAPSASGPWKKLYTYDLADTVALIYGNVFDVDLGGSQKLILQNGTNIDVVHHLRLDQDQLLGGRLVNYKDYFYTVTAYSYEVNKMQPYFIGLNQVGWETAVLENSPRVVTVMPKSSGAVLEVTADHKSGTSDGAVEVAYVDQDAVENANYRVTFEPNPDPKSPDPFVWKLTNLTSNQTVLDGQLQQTADVDDPVAAGIITNVIGPPLAVKSQRFVAEGELGRWIAAVDAGLTGFSGGLGLGLEFFGSSLAPADYSKTVEIRFSTTEADWSQAATYRRDLGYTWAAIGTFPGSVWDVTGATPRRLNVCYVENQTAEKPANLRWDPDDSGNGGREYLFIMNSDYNGAVDYGDDGETHPGPSVRTGTADALIAGWLRVRGGHTFLESNAVWTISNNFINTASDVFEFTTHRAGSVTGTVVDNDIKKIRAVPNPYFNQSSYEQNQFARVMRFVNLPSKQCTIRIFNLAGELVRTLLKEDVEASEIEWDLQSENEIPVASGIYVYHVEAKGIGTTVGKVAVFTEKERLNRF